MKQTTEIYAEINQRLATTKMRRDAAMRENASIEALNHGAVILELMELKHWMEQENTRGE